MVALGRRDWYNRQKGIKNDEHYGNKMSIQRKIKRKKEREERKHIEKDISEKFMMFDRIPEACSACEEPFDKKSKEMAQTWSVVVRKEEKVVRLYCPDCWSKAKTVIENFWREKDLQEGKVDKND